MPRSIAGRVLFAALIGFGACSVNQTGLGGAAGSSSSAGAGGIAATGTAGEGGVPAVAGAAGIGAAGTGGAGIGAAGTGATETGTAGGGAAGTGMAGTAGTGAAGTAETGTAGTAGTGAAGTAGTGAAGTGEAGAGTAGTGGEAGAAGTGTGGVSGSSGGTGGVMCPPCGACLRCGSDGACEPDPSSNWKVTCVSARVSATKPNGQVWDPAYSSPPQSNADPLCRLDTKDGRSHSSPIKMDTLTPVWNADVTPTSGGGLTASLLLGEGQWTISVLDDDPAVPTTETICTVMPQLNAMSLESGMLDFSNVGSCTDLTVTLACVR